MGFRHKVRFTVRFAATGKAIVKILTTVTCNSALEVCTYFHTQKNNEYKYIKIFTKFVEIFGIYVSVS